MIRALAIAALVLVAPPARANGAAVGLLDASGLSEAQSRRALKTAQRALEELSGFEAPSPLPIPRGAPRRACGAELPARSAKVPACLQAAAAGKAPVVLLFSIASSGGRVSADGFFVEAGEVRHQRLTGDEPEPLVRALVAALLPGWAKKGWGGVVVEGSFVSLKLDGEKVLVTPGEPLALTAGAHAIDALFPGGEAVMHRLNVAEGEKTRLEARPLAAARSGVDAPAGDERLRAVSYGLWGAGALAIAGSLIAGATSRHAAADLGTCQGTNRDCLGFEEAAERHREAEAYARTGNVLLGTGAVLSAAGVGLFTFDALSAKEP